MDNFEKFVEKVLSDLSALPEERMRLDSLSKKLRELSPEDGARLIGELYKRGMNDRAAVKALSMLVNPDGLREALGAERYGLIRGAALKLNLNRVARLFSDLPPRKTGIAGYDKEEEAKMEFLTLGHRRSLSKKPVKDTIDRLLSDPDPMVINNILNNPRTTEKEVLKIVSKRPNSVQILKLVASHRVWSKRYEVRKALALNPYTPPRVSIAILELLFMQDLKAISEDKTVHPEVRFSALDLLKEREKGRGVKEGKKA